MARLKGANRAYTTLNGAINDTVTTLVLQDASTFPTSGDFILWVHNADYTVSEIMRGTAITGTSVTVTRAQEGTSAVSHASGAIIDLAFSNGTVDEMWTAIESAVGASKNYLINGNFDIWQRGTSQTTTGYGSDDRWKNSQVGSTKTASRQSFTVGQTDVPNNPTYYARTVVTSVAGASNFVAKIQPIEDVTKLSGETVTLSFWAKADASKNIAIEFRQWFGSGGSSSVSGIGSQKIALTTSWAKQEVTVSIPSISGKTIGTDSSLQLYIWFEAGSTYDSRTDSLGQQSGTFDISQIKLEKGSTATDFIPKSYGEEFIDCKRYYRLYKATGSGQRLFNGISVLATRCDFPISDILNSMRTDLPTITYSDLNIIVGTASYVISSVTQNSSSFKFTITTSATTGQPSHVRTTTATGYIAFDAEL